jgi:predicted MPP superfamily phosphohydrolase
MINDLFKVKKHRVIATKIHNDYTISLISDIHFSKSFKERKLKKIIDKLRTINSNFICIAGDLIDSTSILEDLNNQKKIIAFLKELATISPVIMCLGNHDTHKLVDRKFNSKCSEDINYDWIEKLRRIPNFYLLDNKEIILNEIRFIGLYPKFSYYENESGEELKKNFENYFPHGHDTYKYNVLLCHSPLHVFDDLMMKTKLIKSTNLILSGHTHNGVVPPIIDLINTSRGIYSPDKKWFRKNCRGKVDRKFKSLIINGAITKIHDCSPKIMIPLNELFPMSIDVITIHTVD